MSTQEEESKPTSKQLYTCLLRCFVCLRLLSETRHVEKKPGVKVNYSECPLHKDKGVHVDWEPEVTP